MLGSHPGSSIHMEADVEMMKSWPEEHLLISDY